MGVLRLVGFVASLVALGTGCRLGFDEAASLAIGLGWITVLLLAATVLLRGIAGSPVLQRPSKAHTAHA